MQIERIRRIFTELSVLVVKKMAKIRSIRVLMYLAQNKHGKSFGIDYF